MAEDFEFMMRGIRSGTAEKLVRDKIVSLVGPGTYSFRTAREEEMNTLLANKLREEAGEFACEFWMGDDKERALEEGADLLEILYTAVARLGFSQDDLHQAMLKKRHEKGSFKNKQVLIYE